MKNIRMKKQKQFLFWVLSGAMVTGIVSAQESLDSLAPLTVVGSADKIFELPGSASYLSAEDFRARGHTNLAKIAAKAPSVFVRDEDGYGNFPNISLRGVDGTRSTKVTLMEDGILTAPSPYSAPSAYYSPKASRMSAIEFLKGSSQVKYGPQTTGGVVNYLSTPIPQEGDKKFYSRNTFGSDNTFFNHAYYGDTVTTAAGTFGYLLELHHMSSDGFREIDGSSEDAGFDLFEPMLKLSYEPNTALKQRFEFKAGSTDFDANESYAGLTVQDLRANPNRRYASSQNDLHTAEQFRSYLKWIGEPRDGVRVESSVYFNSFERSWNKLDGLSGAGLRTNVAQALLHAPSLAVLQGFGAGNVFYRDAIRDHEAYGWQNQVNYAFEAGSVSHDLAMGLRFHYDRASGTNQTITYASNGLGGFNAPSFGAVSSAGLSEVFSTAVYVEDQIQIGALTLSPGVRFEQLEVENANKSADEALVMGGLGVNYELNEMSTLIGGIFQGASPANPAGYLGGTDSEESLGLELGYRHKREAFRSELIAFYTDFSQLIAPEVGEGGGGLSPSKNGGSAETMGLESLVEYDAGLAMNSTYSIPVYLSATYTQAEFKGINGSRLGNKAGLFAGAENGNEIPYIPEWKLAMGVSLLAESWGVNLDVSFNGSSWGTGYNDSPRLNDSTGALDTPSAVDGKVDSLLLVDWTGHYQLNETVKLVGGVQNLLDTQKIVSRAPLGARSNAPRTLFAGVEVSF